MTVPTRGETFALMIEHLRKAQELMAMMAHLERDTSRIKATGWLAVSEGVKLMIEQVTKLATKGLQ